MNRRERDWSEEKEEDMTIESSWIESFRERKKNNNNNLSNGSSWRGRNYRWRKVEVRRCDTWWVRFLKADDELFKSGSSYHSLRCGDNSSEPVAAALQETLIFLQLYIYIYICVYTYVNLSIFGSCFGSKAHCSIGSGDIKQREINNNLRNTGEREHTC